MLAIDHNEQRETTTTKPASPGDAACAAHSLSAPMANGDLASALPTAWRAASGSVLSKSRPWSAASLTCRVARFEKSTSTLNDDSGDEWLGQRCCKRMLECKPLVRCVADRPHDGAIIQVDVKKAYSY